MFWLSLALFCQAAAPNLLGNPRFETVGDDGLPDRWRLLRGGPAAVLNDGGHAGPNYLRIEDLSTDESTAVESDHVVARPLGEYTVTGWFRTAATCQPGLYLQFHDGQGGRLAETHTRAEGPTAGWVEVTVTAQAPREAEFVSVLLYGFTADLGSFDVDDLSLTVTGGAEPGSLGIPPAMASPQEVFDVAGRRELFVDDVLVDGLSGSARRQLHRPERQNTALTLDQPWEGPTSTYLTIFRDASGLHLYYRGSGSAPGREVTCVADSPDGVEFTRPSLGLVDWAGSTANNIVWNQTGSHNFAPFYDPRPGCPPDERYKAVGDGLYAYASPDGRQWRLLQPDKILTKGAFDSQNLAFWDAARGQYACYFRTFRNGIRAVEVCWSDDFRTWTDAVPLTYGTSPAEHLYTNAITPYFRAPHLLIGLPARFVPTRHKIASHPEAGVSDAVLMTSRDGVAFTRWAEGFILPGPDPQNWTDRNIYPAWGIVQTSDTEMSVYWTEHYRHDPMRVRRGTLRLDGFVSLRAEADGGEVLTRPLRFEGQRLHLNYATSAIGSVRVAVCDAAGNPLPGFGYADQPALFGDEIEAPLTWSADSNLAALAGQPIRLRFQLVDADVYSFRFGE